MIPIKSKRFAVFALAMLLAAVSCEKQTSPAADPPEREPSVPEKIEKEFLDILSRDWKSLSDTLDFFTSTMLSRGRHRGTGPDGVWYELDIRTGVLHGTDISFTVEDSLMMKINGKIRPLELTMDACGIAVSLVSRRDSLLVSASDISAVVPLDFLLEQGRRAPVIYKGEDVGYLTMEEFENPDYSTGTYLLMQYNDDPRKFALFDNGLGELIRKNLPDVIE